MKRQPWEIYEDRRKYPRIVVRVPAELRFQSKALPALVHDLSPDGLQIRCNRATLKEIRPSGRAIRKDGAPLLDVRFTLTVGRVARTVDAAALLYYFVLLPGEKQADVACGLQFRDLRGKSREYVDAFILDALAPDEGAAPIPPRAKGAGGALKSSAALRVLLRRMLDIEERLARLERVAARRRG